MVKTTKHTFLHIRNDAGGTEHKTLDSNKAINVLRSKFTSVDSLSKVEGTDLSWGVEGKQ